MVEEVIQEKRREFLSASGQVLAGVVGDGSVMPTPLAMRKNHTEPVAFRPPLHSAESSMSRTLSWVVSGLLLYHGQIGN
jgi:hypothetical protein